MSRTKRNVFGAMLAVVSCAALDCGGNSDLLGADDAATSERSTDASDVAAQDATSSDDDGLVPLVPVLDAGPPGYVSDAALVGECNPVQPYVSDTNHVACPPGQACVFNDIGTLTMCLGAVGDGLQGGGCTNQGDCAAGYDCSVEVGIHGTCARFCRYGNGFDDCGSQYSCTPFVTQAYDGSQQIGVCQ